MEGTIWVENGGDNPTENLTITDVVLYKTEGMSQFEELKSFNVDTSVMPVLQPGDSYLYSYAFNFEPVEDAVYKNRADVTITNHSGHLGEEFGPSPADDFSLPDEPTIIPAASCEATVTDEITLPEGFELVSGPGGPWVFDDTGTAEYTVTIRNVNATPNECFDVINDAQLTMCDGCGEDNASVTVQVCAPCEPEMTFEKGGPECVVEGEEIEWTFEICNTGNETLLNVTVIDPPVGETIPIGPIEPGQCIEFNYTTTAEGCEDITNYAFVEADTECGVSLNVTDDHTVDVKCPGLSFEKGGPECVEAGDEIEWTFSIQNTGDGPLSNVVIIDPPVGQTIDVGDLAAGAWYNTTYVTTADTCEDVTNYAFVEADGECGASLNVTDDHTVNVVCPSISIEKDGPDCVVSGEEIEWTISIQNTGDGPLSNVVLVDEDLGETIEIGTLEAGEWRNITLTSVAEGCDEAYNSAYVTAEGECGVGLNVSDDHTVDIVCVDMSFEKGGPECVIMGDEIEWTFEVCNTCNDTLYNITVDDPLLDEVIEIGTLEPGECEQFTRTSMAEGCEDITNTAYVTAEGPVGSSFNMSDDHTVDIVCPAITIEKGGPDEVDPGDTITWTFEVCNTGNETLENVTVDDPYLGETIEIGTMEPGDCEQFTLESVAEQAGTNIENVAYVTADGPCGAELNASDDHLVTVRIVAPPDVGISIEKGGPATVSNGSSIEWTFEVCNTGNYTLSNVTVEDPFFGMTWEYAQALAPGECWEFTHTTMADLEIANETGYICNEATATGQAFGVEVNDTDDHCVEVSECLLNCIEVTKTGPEYAAPGDCITYTITVKNIAKSPLTNVHVVDEMIGLDEWIWCLEPCDTETFEVEYCIPSDWNWCEDGEWLNNTVSVEGWCCNMLCCDEDSWSVLMDVDCIVDIQKVGPSGAEPGETITYDFTVSNLGKCRLICVNVTDPMFGEDWIWEIGDLDPCESVTQSFEYTVPADWSYCEDGDWLSNEATVDAFCCCQDEWISDCDTWDVFIDTCCILVVEKSADKEYAVPGETITYTINVSNEGSCPIGCVEVSDPVLGFSEYIEFLCSCESVERTIEYTVPEDWSYCEDGEWLINEATATGWCCGEEVMDSDSWVVYIDDPCNIEVVKEGPEYAYPGQNITYDITVMNVGYESLHCVEVTDPMLDFSEGIELLPSCESHTWTVEYTVPEDWCCDEYGKYLVNEVTATGWCCDQCSVEDVFVLETPIVCPCSIEVEATGPAEICPDTWINWEVCVTNTGNNTLVNVTVWDDLTGLDETICVLEPGETWCNTTEDYYVEPCSEDCGPYDIYNQFYADGYCCPCESDSTESDTVWTHVKGCCDIEVWKTGPESAEPGETVTWTITVENTGCFPLQCVEIWDNLEGMEMLHEQIETLAPGEQVTFEVSWTVPADWSLCCDGEYVVNEVDVKAYCCECEMWVDDEAQEVLDIIDPCDLRIEKSIVSDDVRPEQTETCCIDDGCFYPGQWITYRIEVMNHGSNPITCIGVWDPALDWEASICGLSSCESEVFEVDWQVPCDWNYCEDGEWFNNTAYASGWCCDQQVTAEDSASAKICVDCSVELYKTGPETAVPGETIQYEIAVHNTGKNPLCCIRVADYLTIDDSDSVPVWWPVDSMTIDCLEPCEWYNFTVEFTVPDDWTYCAYGDMLYNHVELFGQCCCCVVTDEACMVTEIVDIPPTIDVEKEKLGGDEAVPGECITYEITISNPNEYALSCIHVVDEMLGLDEYICCLEPCSEVVWRIDYQVPADWSYCEDGEWLINEIFVEGYYFDQYVSDEDMEDVYIWDCCDLRVYKSADVTDAEPGDTINYTITVWNAGMNPISCVDVTDEMLGLDEHILCLESCESVTYEMQYTVPEDWTYCCDGEWLTNTAEAVGFCCGEMVEASAEVSVMIHQEACVQVEKTGPETAKNGETITWDITVKNCGSNAIGCVYLTDELLGIERMELGCLEPCEVWEGSFEWTVPEDYTFCEEGEITNTVFVETYMKDQYLTAEDSHDVTIIAPCQVDIYKEANKEEAYPGDKVKYTIRVHNSGDRSLNCINISDPAIGFYLNRSGPLSPGDWINKSIRFQIPEEPECGDYDFINTAMVKATCCGEGDECCRLSAEAEHTLKVLPPCSIEVFKDAPEVAQPGETIEYEISIHNDGIVDLTHIRVVDELLGIDEIIGCLEPCEWHNITVNYSVPEDWTWCSHGSWLNNSVEVSGVCCDCEASDSAMTSTWIESPSLIVEKEGPEEAWPGDEVTYTITVKNVGPTAVTCVEVSDIWMGNEMHIGSISCLMPCESQEFTVTMTVPDPWPYCRVGENLTNIAVAEGWSCCKKVCASDTVDTFIHAEFQIGIWKENLSQFDIARPGDTVYYKIWVKNIGMMDLSEVTVYDELTGQEWNIDCLESCEAQCFEVEYTIPDDWSYCANGEWLINTAWVEGWGCGERVYAETNETTMVIDAYHVEVEKTGPEEACPGDEVTYTITVSNLGWAPICCLHIMDWVTDDRGNHMAVLLDEMIWCLDPCESVNFTVSFTIPLDWNWCDNGEYLNNHVMVWGCGCYSLVWDDPFVMDYDCWSVHIPVECCPHDQEC
ncbi:MAG: hypothetical protein ACLFUV_01290 [Methanomassiliicoccales archaeon]